MAAMACLHHCLIPASSLSQFRSRNSSISCSLPSQNLIVGFFMVRSSGNLPVSGSSKAVGRLESLFYTDSGIPEEKIDRPTGLPKGVRAIGNNPRCPECKAKGVVECATCSGSGLYVDSVLESQGIIVKVRCLGCGGIGNHMCLQCGGRGHV